MSEPVAIIQRNKSGMIYLVGPRGGHFDMSKHIDSSLYLGDAIERKDAAIAELVQAGRAVVDRWDSPLWKDLPHTGEFIARLRAAIAKYDK